jgi:hypothetical protein
MTWPGRFGQLRFAVAVGLQFFVHGFAAFQKSLEQCLQRTGAQPQVGGKKRISQV